MNFTVKFRIPIIIIALILTFCIGFFVTKVEKNSSIYSLVPDNNPDMRFYKKVEEIFGNTQTVIIGIGSKESIYQKAVFLAINKASQFIKTLPDIDAESVVSLTTVNSILTRDQELVIEPMITDVNALSQEMINQIRNQIRNNPFYNQRLVNQAENNTVVTASVNLAFFHDSKKNYILLEQLEQFIRQIKKDYPQIDFQATGTAVGYAKTSYYMDNDIARLVPFTILIIILIIFLFIKNIAATAIPLSVALIAIIWVFGLKGLLHSPITITETTIPVILLAICTCDGIHIINEFFHRRKTDKLHKTAIIETMDLFKIPIILTSITTAVGFLSLITSTGQSIKNKGLYVAFGVIIAMFYSLLFIPAVLTFFKKKDLMNKPNHASKTGLQAIKHWNNKITQSLWRKNKLIALWINHHKLIIIIVSVIVTVISIAGIFYIRVDSDLTTFFHDKDPLTIATQKINQKMGGISDLYIVISGKEADSLNEPVILKKMLELQRFAEKDTAVSFTYSLADYVQYMYYLLNDRKTEFNRLPNTNEQIEIDGIKKTVAGREQISNILFLYQLGGGGILKDLVNTDYSMGCVHVRLKNTESKVVKALVKKLNVFINDNIPKEYTTHFSGYYMFVIMSQLIVESQIYSLLSTFIMIFLILIIIYRSVKFGFMLIMPTLFAVLFNFGFMWIFQIPLNVGTAIIASVGLGIGIDYSIHFYSRFKYLFQQYRNYKVALVKTYESITGGIITNALAVGFGFLVLLFSNFKVISYIGLIISISMATTAAGSLVVLPAFLLAFKPKTDIRKDL